MAKYRRKGQPPRTGHNTKAAMYLPEDVESSPIANALAFMHPSTRPAPKKEKQHGPL